MRSVLYSLGQGYDDSYKFNTGTYVLFKCRISGLGRAFGAPAAQIGKLFALRDCAESVGNSKTKAYRYRVSAGLKKVYLTYSYASGNELSFRLKFLLF